MTPSARHQAAIGILDDILAGRPAEPALIRWSRGARYAGSSDRAAVRDLVFDALRRKRSAASLGGSETGRGLILGLLRAMGDDPATVFTGMPYAPRALAAADTGKDPEGFAALDCPDWLGPILQEGLGPSFAPVMTLMQSRAPVFLRVNTARVSIAAAQAALAAQGIETRPVPLAAAALEVTAGARKVQASSTYEMGLVELQDAASQAVVQDLPLRDGARVLDLCAGGGGKTLAMAAHRSLSLFAHDANPGRMVDLPVRAARAGVTVATLANPAEAAPYDLVLADAPCSGSGSWRRDPEGKWSLDEKQLGALLRVQAQILDRAERLVAQDGHLAYVTCSMILEENARQVDKFLTRHPEWHLVSSRQLTPLDGGDGFFVAILARR